MDIEYWNNFYNTHTLEIDQNSLFSSFVVDKCKLVAGNKILELGCGNGRDALYFEKQGLSVTAIDQIDSGFYHNHKNITFICGDFVNVKEFVGINQKFDCIYSRFTLHSITQRQEDSLLRGLSSMVKIGGFLAIEVRGKKNSLYLKGERVKDEEDAFYYNDHYRRFIDFEKFCKKIKEEFKNIKILFAEESTGFAPFDGQDDYFVRIIVEFL